MGDLESAAKVFRDSKESALEEFATQVAWTLAKEMGKAPAGSGRDFEFDRFRDALFEALQHIA